MQSESLKKLDHVYQQLEHRITTGFWKVGERIPTEAELAVEFRCSRGTVSKAVARLTHEGMVTRKTRAGTIVTRNTLDTKNPAIDLNACAFICPSDQHEGIWRIARGFQHGAHQANRRTIVLTTGAEFRKEAEIISHLAEFNVKGAVIYCVIPNSTEEIRYAQVIQSCPFPVVLVELNLHGTGRPAIVADGLHAGYTVTRHLLQQGLREIGFLCNYSWVPYMRDRYLGYRQAMDEAGLKINSDHVLLDPCMHPSYDNSLEEPTQMATGYLKTHPTLQGIVCATDFLAHGCLLAARDLGIEVPRQLKVVGIDDFQSLRSTDIALTTYHIPYEAMGEAAFHTFDTCLQTGQSHPSEQQLRGHLVVRDSA